MIVTILILAALVPIISIAFAAIAIGIAGAVQEQEGNFYG